MKKFNSSNIFYGFVIMLSIFSFVFINANPCANFNSQSEIETIKPENQDQDPGSFSLPDVELLKNIVETVIHLIPVS